MARGEPAPEAAQGELARNPDADAGIIALDSKGRIFAGNTELVERRSDTGRALLRGRDGDSAVAVLHNAIHPHGPLAQLAAAIALDVIAPLDRADLWVRLEAGTPVELGVENAVLVDDANVARRVTVTERKWLLGHRQGAVIGFAAAVRRGDELMGHATVEPYGVVEAGRIVSLSGAAQIDLGVRLLRAERA